MGLTKAQKASVQHFQAVTGADATSAQHFLQMTSWDVARACNMFLDGGAPVTAAPPSKFNAAAVTKLFEKYRDKRDDLIMAAGVEAFCKDLRVDPADVVMLVISYHFRAKNSCEFDREEFVKGMTDLKCDSISKLAALIPSLRQELQDPGRFQEVYRYAYGFSCEKGQKCVHLDMALAMWQLIFSEKPWPLLDLWLEFLQKNHKKAISRDTWIQLLDFIKTFKPDLSDFVEDEHDSAWPYLIDDFVEYARENMSSTDKDLVLVD